MAFSFKQQKVEAEEEKRILIGAITSTNFLKDLYPICKPSLFRVSYSQRIYKWVMQWYEKYEEAPQQHIEDIFELEKENLSVSEADLIAQFLSNLSELYEQQFNEQWVFDRAERYLKTRSLQLHREKIGTLLDNDRVEEAEEEIAGFKKVARATSPWVNPHDPSFITRVRSTQRQKMFRLKGALGQLVGDLWRKETIGIQGQYKGGKSFLAHEFVIEALKNRFKVAEVNLEMSEERVSDRHWRRMLGTGDKSKDYVYPVFDCYKNQIGACRLPHCASPNVKLYDPDSEDKPYSILKAPINYFPCTYCRSHHQLSDEYRLETWYTKIAKTELTTDLIIRHTSNAMRMWGDNYRLKCYPRFGASMSDIERDLDLLEYTEGFIPDVLLIDYIDIAKPEDFSGDSEEQRKNDLWMRFAGLVSERSMLGVTLTQIKALAMSRKKGKMGDASWSQRIYGHVDKFLAVNATNEEKMMGQSRINMVAARNEDFNEMVEVMVLQQLEVSRAILDSEFKAEY